MPFGKTTSCTEEEWTSIFEELFKPVIMELGYECRRSNATRGSLIKGIIQDLDLGWVVLADLTDQNPNVFYELGVRHALKDRTILVAQNRNFIPFDLESYANHVYDWKTPKGKEEFTAKITALFEDVDRDPNREDNPVSDFLGTAERVIRNRPIEPRVEEIEQRLEVLEVTMRAIGGRTDNVSVRGSANAVKQLPFLEEDSGSAPWFQAGVQIAETEDERILRNLERRAREEIRTEMPQILGNIVVSNPPGKQIQNEEIPKVAAQYELAVTKRFSSIEQLTLGLSTIEWKPGARMILRICGAIVEAGEGLTGLKFTTGLPAFLGWKMLLNSAATAWASGANGMVEVLLTEPIPVTQLGGRRTLRSILQRKDLFYPTFVLGYANHGIQQLVTQFQRSENLGHFFQSQEEYNIALAQVLIIVAISDARGESHPIWPGYRVVPGLREAYADLIAVARTDRRQLISRILKVDEEKLEDEWRRLAEIANRAELGSQFWNNENKIPTDLGAEEV
jgi:hypothetical protein